MSSDSLPPYIGGFEILGEIGRGGMGVVYRARDPALQRDLAIKVQSGNWDEHREEMERFLREARILAKINHPNVVQIYSVGMHEGSPSFAMELLERSVADAARLRMPSVNQLKRWMFEAARGLAAIHDMGVVHRDIKPANLLLSTPTSVENEHVKIADLGIASSGDLFGTRLTQSGMVLGTTGYLAPEAWHPEANLDGRADQYALGVVFFELLAGRSPHQFDSDAEAIEVMMAPPEAPDVREFRADVDAATAELIAKMLRVKPRERFATTTELVQALLAILPPSGADYRSPTPKPMAAPAAPAAIDSSRTRLYEAPTLARQAPARTRTRMRWLVLIPALILLPGLAWYVWRSATRLDERVSAVPAISTVVPASGEPDEAASPTAASRSAWADYLLGHYYLRAEGHEALLTLTLQSQEAGRFKASLEGLEAEALPLRGEVLSQVDEDREGVVWTVSEVRLTGPKKLQLALRIAFNDQDTEGTGAMQRRDQHWLLSIDSSEDL